MSCHYDQKNFNFEGCCNNKIRYFKALFVGVGTKITAFGFEPFSRLCFGHLSNLSYSLCLWHGESAVTSLSIIIFLKRFRHHVQAISGSCRPHEFFVPIFCSRARWTLTFSIYTQKRRHFGVLRVLNNIIITKLPYFNLSWKRT